MPRNQEPALPGSRGRQCPKPRSRHRPESKKPALPRIQGGGIAPSQGAGLDPSQGPASPPSQETGDRSIGKAGGAANAKNGKSQESSFFPATFRYSLFFKLYVFPSERNCCGSQSKCRSQCQYDPKPWLTAVAGLSGFIISSSFVGFVGIGGS